MPLLRSIFLLNYFGFSALLLTLLCIVGEAEAQVFQLGPKGGAQMSTLKLEDDPRADGFDISPVVGYNLGAALIYDFTEKTSMKTELSWSRKGANIDIKETGLKNKVRFNHIEWSGLFRVHLNKVDPKRVGKPVFHLMFGPNISYWLGGKGNLSGGELTFFEPIDYRVTFNQNDPEISRLSYNDPNRLQLGFDMGIGAELKVYKEQRLTVNLRYIVTHTNIAPTDAASEIRLLTFDDFTRAANRLVTLTLAYTFQIDVFSGNQGKSSFGKTNKVRNKPIKKSKQN